MANQVRVGVGVTGAKGAASELDRFRDKFEKLQKQGAKGLAIGVGVGAATASLNLLGSAVGGVTDYIGEAIKAASDLNETESKAKVVFGAAAKSVDDFGSTAATSLGISKQAAIEAAASFGNVFTGVDIGQKQAAQMSTTLVKLAGDLASFNNLDPTEALDKLRSGLAGEAEPLRSVGVFLTEAQVKAKAMQLGLADAHGELSEGAKIIARYQLILEQTTTAQGDFARTSDGVANKERILNAELEDREAIIGQKLIPLELAWLDIRLKLADATSDFLDTLDPEKPFDYSMGLNKLNVAGGETARIFSNVGRESDKAGGALGTLGLTSQTAGQKLGGAANKADDLKDIFRDLKTATKDTESAIDDLTDSVETGLFGRAINAGHEAQLKLTIKDLIEQRGEVHKGSLKYIELTGEIAENEKALFDLHLEMAAAKGPQAAIDFLRREKARTGDLSGALQKLIDKYSYLAGLQGKLGPIIVGRDPGHHTGLGGRASGGPVSKGTAYTVGERGPETFVAPSNGTIIPTNGRLPTTGGGWGDGSLNVNVNVSGGLMTPGVSDELARNLGPAIVKYMQQRGMVTGARAF
jgi:hypothetical protein